MAMFHRPHHLDCFVFCVIERKHRCATVFLEQRYTVHETRSFFSDDHTILSTRIQEILCLLACGRTLPVMLSPQVSSLSVARKNRPPRSATRPWGLPALKFVYKMLVHQRQFVCRHLSASGQSMHQFKDSFLSRQPSRLVCVEIQWTAKFDQQCVVLNIHHCASGSHWRKATRLVFGGQSGRACFHSLYSYSFRRHGKHWFCSFQEGNKHLLLQGSLTQPSAKYPPRLVQPSLRGSWWIHDSSEIGRTLPL